jgi:ribosome-binding protein aMBF1 (putative translation factor)
MITAAQCRAARALLHWSQEQLGRASDISPTAIRLYEVEQAVPTASQLKALEKALKAAGIEFVSEQDQTVGVLLKGDTKLAT